MNLPRTCRARDLDLDLDRALARFRRARARRARYRVIDLHRAIARPQVADVGAELWDRRPASRLLHLVAAVLPSDQRARFVEEQAACLAFIESRWDQAVYLIDLLAELPRIAWTYRRARRRTRVR